MSDFIFSDPRNEGHAKTSTLMLIAPDQPSTKSIVIEVAVLIVALMVTGYIFYSLFDGYDGAKQESTITSEQVESSSSEGDMGVA